LATLRYGFPIRKCLRAGASGYVLKDARPDSVISSILAVMSGERVMASAVANRVLDLLTVAGGGAEHRSHHEQDTGLPPQRETQEDEDGRPDAGDDRVLAVQIGAGPLLYRLRDLLHAVVALGLAQRPHDEHHRVGQGQQPRRADRQEHNEIQVRHTRPE